MESFLTRTPIADENGHVLGFELAQGVLPDTVRDDFATPVLLDALLRVHLEDWAAGRAAFLAVSPQMIAEPALQELDPRSVVLLLDSNLQTPQTLERCRRLVKAGFRFGVDRPLFPAVGDPVLQLAKTARVSVRAHPGKRLEQLVRQLAPYKLELLAHGAEELDERDGCRALGIHLFAGFARGGRETCEPPAETLQLFELLRAARAPEVSEARLAVLIDNHPELARRLLRLLNSAALTGRRAESIAQAVPLLGRKALPRWLAVLLLDPGDAEVEVEIARSALLRARLCEQLGLLTDRPWAGTALYVLGILSRLDLLLGVPMESLVERMGLSEEANEALLRRTGPDGEVLALAESYERGDWPRVVERGRALDVDLAQLPALYREALSSALAQSLPA